MARAVARSLLLLLSLTVFDSAGLLGCPALLSDDFVVRDDAEADVHDGAGDDGAVQPGQEAGTAADATPTPTCGPSTCNGCCWKAQNPPDTICLISMVTMCGAAGRACVDCTTYGAYCNGDGFCSIDPVGAPPGWCMSTAGCSTNGGPAADASAAVCGPTSSVQNCGACGQACDTTTGTPSCDGVTCSYTCAAGRADCDLATPDTNGCECATPSCCAGGGCQMTHSNGVGQSYYDCMALGTYTSAQAMAACAAAQYTNCKDDSKGVCGSVSSASGTPCTCWDYSASAPQPMRVPTGTWSGANCAFASGAVYPMWN